MVSPSKRHTQFTQRVNQPDYIQYSGAQPRSTNTYIERPERIRIGSPIAAVQIAQARVLELLLNEYGTG